MREINVLHNISANCAKQVSHPEHVVKIG